MDELEYGTPAGKGRMQCSGVGNERNDGDIFDRFESGTGIFRQQILDAELLGNEKTIEGGKTEPALAADEIRDMRRAKAGLAGEKCTGELSPVDAASYFDSKPFVKLRKIHLWNFFFELNAPTRRFADCKAS